VGLILNDLRVYCSWTRIEKVNFNILLLVMYYSLGLRVLITIQYLYRKISQYFFLEIEKYWRNYNVYYKMRMSNDVQWALLIYNVLYITMYYDNDGSLSVLNRGRETAWHPSQSHCVYLFIILFGILSPSSSHPAACKPAAYLRRAGGEDARLRFSHFEVAILYAVLELSHIVTFVLFIYDCCFGRYCSRLNHVFRP